MQRDRTDIFYTITLLISIYGGLIILLRITAPFVISTLFKYKSSRIISSSDTGTFLSQNERIVSLFGITFPSAQCVIRSKTCVVGETIQPVQVS